MNNDMWIKIVGGIAIFIAVAELFIGAAWEKTGRVYRREQPIRFWLSIICKFAVGLAILNIQYLRARFGG